MITLKNFSYYYPGSESASLQRISLDIPEGEFLGIVGANGAGKSTLCYTLSGFVPHFYNGKTQGTHTFDGQPVAGLSLGQLAGQIGLVFQNSFNQISGARFTVREEIAFGLENLGLPRSEMHARIDEALELVNITELAERSPFSVSGGQQQRIAIASILAMKPRVLVLDEPTSQLDPDGTRDVFAALNQLVRTRKITVIIAEHKLEWLATFCTRIIALEAGKLRMQGHPDEVLSSERMLKLGIGRTQYSEVAARLLRREQLPVTLEQTRKALK